MPEPSPMLTAPARRAMQALVANLLGNPVEVAVDALPLTLVRRHMLAPLAHRAGAATLRNDFIASALQAERRAALAVEALAALGDAGVAVILLKGIAYTGTLYADPAERPMSDIDLLVRAADFDRAARALLRLGYWHAGGAAQITVTRHALTLKRRDSAIDLHRHILHAGRSRIDLAAVWHDARPSHLAGALRAAPLHEYLLHVAHIGRHEGGVPLINFVDAARLRARVPAAEVNALAAAWSVARATAAVSRALEGLRAGSADGEPGSARGLGFPTSAELIAFASPPRWLQLVRKVHMVDDWRGLVGLAAATARSRVAPLRRRSE